ncbi:MAG: ABC transporter substrate-binding protein [Oscillospiraceae bacterium]|nr:ABC transporter substrate-binding protein [Oscillospiraceae bacterium]
MMKKIFALVLALAMALALVACGGGDDGTADQSSGEKVVKIGVFEPQTGDNGAGGKQEILGMQYANYVQPTVSIGGEEYQVKLEIVDNRTTAENGPSAAAELVNRGVSVVLGSYGSGVSMAGGAVFSEAGIPAIGVTCTNPQVTSDCDVYYRICFLDPFQGTVLANYAYKELGVTTAYTLAMLGSDYDQGLVYYFTEAFKALGGTVVAEDFPEGSANFVSYINNAKSAGAGVIFAPVSTNYAQLIIEAAAAQGYTGDLLGSDTWDNNMVVESSKGKDVSVKITTFYQEGGNPEFDAGIKEWMNANPDALTNNGGNDMVSAVTAMGYDAYFTALQAIEKAGSTDPKAILEALPSVSYKGVSGLIEFDEIGDAKRDVAYIKAANTESGEWEFVKIQGVN